MSDALIAFLRTRLDDDEQVARAALWAGDECWDTFADPNRYDAWSIVDVSYDEGVAEVQPHAASSEGVARHIVRQQPLRVLAEVAAKRRIVDLYAQTLADPSSDDWDDHRSGYLGALERVLREVARTHADHPDFDAAWAVDTPQ